MAEFYVVKCSDCRDELYSKFKPIEKSPIFCDKCESKYSNAVFAGNAYVTTCTVCKMEFGCVFPFQGFSRNPTKFLAEKPILCRDCYKNAKSKRF